VAKVKDIQSYEEDKMKIVTDSAADLTADDINLHDIHVVPLFIQFPEHEISSADMSADDFYNRLRSMEPKVPTTAQPSIGNFIEVYQKLVNVGEEILSIHISNGLSGTVQTARSAAQQLPDAKITVIDTLTLSTGQRTQVLVAAMAIKAGWSVEKILERLSKIEQETETIFTLETLDYLIRGGRIGRVQAIAGTLLKIKPVIRVDHADGKYSTVSRGRTLQQTMTAITDHLVNLYGANQPLWLTVMHGQFAEKAAALIVMLKNALTVSKIEVLRVSPVLGVHTGPGVVGVGALPLRLVEDLM
jgi:DegV family protein with EDD domain